MKLHLGCGNKKIHGWVNVDTRKEESPDVVLDIKNIHKKYNNAVDIIYVSHVLEHFDKHSIKNVLDSWYKALKPGGTLRISVPDFEAVVSRYLVCKDMDELQGFLVGGQKNPFDYHYQVFDFPRLCTVLEESNFKDFKISDWRTWDHSYVDDYSQAYLPHMDKINRMLMSINMECKK